MTTSKAMTVMGGVLVTLTLSYLPGAAQAQTADASSFHADAEVDPFAYAFGGYSVHVGMGYRGLRFDLGAYAFDTPSFLEAHDDFQSSRQGYGLKAQYFPSGSHTGGFFGVQAEFARELVESELSDAAHRQGALNLGLNLGWRFMFGDLYVMPWLLLNYTLGAEDVHLDGNTYEATAFFPFPTVHVGYRFH